MARRWEAEGAERIHLVDLDAAIDGLPQPEAVGAVIAAVRIPVEVGGGIRTLEDAQRYRDLGAERVIFGTAAVSRPDVVQAAVSRWPEAVAVAIDARDGRVAVSGLERGHGRGRARPGGHRRELGRRARAVHGRARGTGRSSARTSRRSRRSAGGRACGSPPRVASPTSRTWCACAALEPFGVDEAIVGKALYEGRVSLAEARKALAEGEATR